MRRIASLLFAVAVLPSWLRAQIPAAPAMSSEDRIDVPIDVVLTVSGGISRGSYQGGLNWGLIEIMRRSTYDPAFRQSLRTLAFPRQPRFNVTAAGGASAGNINGLLSAIEWCRTDGETRYDRSVFWQAWAWTGWEQLMHKSKRTMPDEQGIIDRWFFSTVIRPAIAEQIGRKRGFRPDCDVPVGVTTTRLRHDQVTVDSGVIARSQRNAILFHVDAPDGNLRIDQPSSRALGDPTIGEVLILVDTTKRGALAPIGLEGVFPAIEASSAFPLAFGPRTLDIVKADLVTSDRRCPENALGRATCDRAQFVDGGVFDNNPLGVAYGLHRCASDERRGATVSSRVCAGDTTRAPVIVYMDPDARRDNDGRLIEEPLRRERVEGLSAIPQLLGGIVTSGREYELAVFKRTLAVLPGGSAVRVIPTDRYHGIVGDHFSAFGAFLGRPFREYDFYVGIYDATRFAAKRWLCPRADSLQPDSVTAACIRNATSALACGALIARDSVAQPILSLLHKQEHRTPPDCAELGRLAGDSTGLQPTIPSEAGSADRLRVLLTMAEANEAIRRRLALGRVRDPFRCARKEYLQQLVCLNGFGILMEHLREDSAHAALTRLAKAPACTRAWQNDAASAYAIRASLDDCHADNMLIHLAADPIDVVDEQIRNVLRRLKKVEDGRKYEKTIDIAEFVYRNGREPHINWTIAPVSPIIANTELHRIPGLFTYLVPFHLSGATRADQVVVGYRPTVYMVRRTSLVFPLEWSRGRFGSGSTGLVSGEERTSVGVGIAYIAGTALWGSTQATAFTASKAWTCPEWTSEKHFGLELSSHFLGNRMRIAWRLLPRADRPGDASKRQGLLFGISDLSGLVYWTARTLW